MAENKRKHLEFIQGVITRHNSNSFMLKGWVIAIASALYALAGAIKEPNVVFIALAPIVLFWGLDAYYLSNERCFIDLFNAVAEGRCRLPTKSIEKDKVTSNTILVNVVTSRFDMNYKRFKIWKENCWWDALWSPSIIFLYIIMIVITYVIGFFFYEF